MFVPRCLYDSEMLEAHQMFVTFAVCSEMFVMFVRLRFVCTMFVCTMFVCDVCVHEMFVGKFGINSVTAAIFFSVRNLP